MSDSQGGVGGLFDLVPPPPKTNKHLNLQVGGSNATQGRARSCAGGGGRYLPYEYLSAH